MSILEVPSAAKVSRKRSLKAARQEDAPKQKVTLHLSAEMVRRLGVYAVMTSNTNSSVVENLIAEHLRKFVVHVHNDRAGHEAPGNISASAI